MHKVSFPCVDGVDAEDLMQGSQVSSLDVIEALIESHVNGNDVEPLMT